MSGKTIFIKGASSGIGAATARMAADRGWYVGLFARSEDRLAALGKQFGDAATILPGDATDFASQWDAVERLVQKTSGLDAAFANAGTGLSAAGT